MWSITCGPFIFRTARRSRKHNCGSQLIKFYFLVTWAMSYQIPSFELWSLSS